MSISSCLTLISKPRDTHKKSNISRINLDLLHLGLLATSSAKGVEGVLDGILVDLGRGLVFAVVGVEAGQGSLSLAVLGGLGRGLDLFFDVTASGALDDGRWLFIFGHYELGLCVCGLLELLLELELCWLLQCH